ncbi:hypothetical protein V5F41_13145 [Xanthobacter autotrophicus]|uniref:hypothetical protein n=1 Tax=Xanthobacter autotrophicus TaxID=280 RepID=UPI00372BC8F4
MVFVNFIPPDLYKFCPSKFDITKGCNTIRVGTLNEFRLIENHLLQDAGEGEFNYNIRFPQLTQVSEEWIRELRFGSEQYIHVEQMVYEGTQAYIKGVTISGYDHNCWIYCLSESGDGAGNISEAHQSKWMLSGSKIGEFARYLANMLMQNIKIEDLPLGIIEKYTIAEISEGISVNYKFGRVRYVNRIYDINNESDYPVERLKELRGDIPFIKPEKFSDEKEFRFAFFLNFRGNRISVNSDKKIIQMRGVDKFLNDE